MTREDGHWEKLLPRFSLDRRITVLVLVATALVVGAVATVGIPLELIPAGFTAPFLRVSAAWRDAPPGEVLDKVVLPLEEELSTVGGLDRMNSMARTGGGFVWLRFKQGTDMDVAYREVRDRIERAKPHLPDDADRVEIEKHDAAGIPVMVVGVAVDPEVADVYELIQNEIVLPLSRVDGVATVDSNGLQQRELVIELDREATAAAGLNIYGLAQELAGDNFSLASGTVRHGGRKLLLRSVSRYDDIDAVRNRLVTPSIRLKDIATIRYMLPETQWRVRVNGRPALALEIMKEGQANTMEVTRRLRAEFERLQANPRLQGFYLAVLFDQGNVIMESLSTLTNSGMIGAIFAVMVLFFFLRRFRLTLIITLSIPLSMVIALTVMYFAGESLNILSLLGLMICVGLLVDNSVVVAENIHRLHKQGLSRRDACVEGAGEIALAIVLATLTTVVVFLPVSLVEGQGQFFLLRLAIPISISLLASLLVALIFIPLTVYLTIRNGRGPAGLTPRVHRAVDRLLGGLYRATLERMNHLYTRALAFFLRRRFDLVLAVIALFAVTQMVAFKNVKMVDSSEEERPGFQIDVEVPPSYTLEDTDELFVAIEKELEGIKQELKLDGYFVVFTNRWGELEGWFTEETTQSPREATEMVMKVLPKKPGVKYELPEDSQVEDDDKDKGVFAIELQGEDVDVLETLATRLEQVFVRVPGVLGVKRVGDRVPNELALVVDRVRAQQQGVTSQVVAGVVGYALRGQALPSYYQEGKEIPVRVRFAEEDRESLVDLADFAVPTAAGGAVQLSALTSVEYLTTPKGIFRSDKRISRSITLELEQGKEEETRENLMGLMRAADLPEGVTFGGGSLGSGADEDIEAMKFAAAVSILFIYLLMGFLFESFILPLSIILTIPLASIGVGWLHYLTGRDLDFLGVVGVILLIGVVVNNGIVLIDYVNRLRGEGHDRSEALLLAAERRFRPILMTAGTTICGMIPLTVGKASSIGLSYRSFGLTLIGGLVTATALTLLVVPVFYTLFDDAREIMGRLVRSRGRTAPSPSVAEESLS